MQHWIDLLPTAQAACSIVALITRAILAILTVRYRTTTRMEPESTPGIYSGTTTSESVEARGSETVNHNEISRVLRTTLHTAKICAAVTTVLQCLHQTGAL
jgi:hypothetical protein